MRNRVTKTLLNSTPHDIKIVFIHFYYDELIFQDGIIKIDESKRTCKKN